MANSLAGKNFREAVSRPAVFPLSRTGGDVNVAGGDLFVEPGIAHIGEVIDGVVEIEIVVVHAVHEIFHVVNAGHGKASLDDIGVLEKRIRGMVRAKGSAHRGDGDAGRLAVVPDEGNDFFAQIGIKNGLDVAAMKRMRAFIVETEPIDGIDGEEFYSSSVDEIRERADHALSFELHLVAGAGGKAQQRRAVMAINDHTELDTEARRVPAVIFAFHPIPLAHRGERKYASVAGCRAIALDGESSPTVVSIPRRLR